MSKEERFVTFKERSAIIAELDRLAEARNVSRSDLIRFGLRGILRSAQKK